jgi:hypothetical protein
MKSVKFMAYLLLTALAFFSPAVATEEEPLDKMIARADSSGDHKAELYAKVAQREVEVAAQSFTVGNAGSGYAAVQLVVEYADKSLAAARQFHKRLKQAEIALREASRRLNDVQETLTLEERPRVKAAVEHLEDIRSDLLKLMFAPPQKREK